MITRPTGRAAPRAYNPTMARRGVILFAHGARDPRWREPFEALASRFAELEPGVPVELAFLEFMSPDLPAAARSLAAQGCDVVTIVPAFLGVGGHVRRDVPGLMAEIERELPGVELKLAASLGENPAVQEAMARASAAAAKA